MFLHLSVILFTGGSLSREVSVQGGSLSRGVLCQGGVSVQGVSVRETPPHIQWTSGQYASYWNAFLFSVLSKSTSGSVKVPMEAIG